VEGSIKGVYLLVSEPRGKQKGLLRGAVWSGAVAGFYFQRSDIWWSIAGLAVLVMGISAALFGWRVWETAVGLWP
jgi:hypothetical protein